MTHIKLYPISRGWYLEYIDDVYNRHVYDKDREHSEESSVRSVLERDYTSSGTTDSRPTVTHRE